jgi:endonuclease/exonuclease/phosphatase family metal-dependent hydrolase
MQDTGSTIKIATWNIYWLGDREGKVVRGPQHEQLIAQVIGHIAPDVLALEEIVDPFVMERILEQASGEGREYVIRSGEGDWLTSDPDPADPENGRQKVFLCVNRETVDLLRGASLRGGPAGYGFRRPYAALLRHRASDTEFVAVAVHLRSGYPSFLDKEDAQNRQKEAIAVASWLQGEATGENPAFPEPGRDEIVVLGDFNAEHNDPAHAEPKDPNRSLDPLRDALCCWTWKDPEPDGERWETAIYAGDRYVIDFMLLSPAMAARVVVPPQIYAWDYDSAMGGPTRFHYGPDGSGNLKGYEVSDHRPVFAVLAF